MRTPRRIVASSVLVSLLIGAPALGQTDAQVDDGIRLGVRKATPKAPGTLRLATYNVENMFDEKDDPAVVDNPSTPRSEDDKDIFKPQEELEAVAAAIRAIDADVLALQEVESEEVVRWFRDTYLADMGYEHVASLDSGDRRGIECSVLSRFPLSGAEVWPGADLGGVHPEKWGNGRNWQAGEPIVFRRSPLKVDVSVPVEGSGDAPASTRFGAEPAGGDGGSYDLTLFVVHHKSGRPGGYWREREARWIASKVATIESSDPDANVIVLGDFNAEPGASSHAVYAGAGMLDVFGDVDRTDPKWVTHSSGRVIDHIVVNEGAFREVLPESRFVLGTPHRPEGSDWRVIAPPVGYASDHLPVVVDLMVGDQ